MGGGEKETENPSNNVFLTGCSNAGQFDHVTIKLSISEFLISIALSKLLYSAEFFFLPESCEKTLVVIV